MAFVLLLKVEGERKPTIREPSATNSCQLCCVKSVEKKVIGRVYLANNHSVKRIRVRSSLVRSIGYDPLSATLTVEYATGDLYEYFMVPKLLVGELLAADSIGTFVIERIQKRFPFKRTRAE